jgi:hypothetical protein
MSMDLVLTAVNLWHETLNEFTGTTGEDSDE